MLRPIEGFGARQGEQLCRASEIALDARFEPSNTETRMLTGGLLWLIGIPIPLIILIWFFFLRGR